MAINFYFEDKKPFYLNQTFKKQWIKNCISKYNKQTGNINYIFCSDEYLLQINKEYLKHDYYTDIITFNYCEKNIINSDIYISIDRVKENSKEYNLAFLEELNRVIIHGILHLVGFKDHSDLEKIQMRKKEDICLNNYYNKKLI
ncbi:MAG: rRNA maturation RNase YbeY [Bacteroidales bacterium]|nr:rRNA maturation RNase YbeY [Bacteroidales bacterium]MBN2758181.1 rRNA maturation RNase YbeY [Bacteroidales bacterium]